MYTGRDFCVNALMVIKITVIHKYKQREVLMKKEKLKVICIYSGEEDAAELKRIYRKLIKKLHPDLNKESSKRDLELLLQVTKAYENGDLTTLRNLELLASEIVEKETIDISEMEGLESTKQRYKIIINEILKNIEEIKLKFPYNQKDFLKKPKLVQVKIEELNKLMEDYKNLYEELDKVLNKLKGENNG